MWIELKKTENGKRNKKNHYLKIKQFDAKDPFHFKNSAK